MPNGTTLPGSGRSGPTIREVSAGDRLGGDYLCARYLDGDLRCARLRATEGAERMLAVDGRLCVFTRQRTVTYRSAAGSRWGAHEQTLALER